jgi:hypothetical protein
MVSRGFHSPLAARRYSRLSTLTGARPKLLGLMRGTAATTRRRPRPHVSAGARRAVTGGFRGCDHPAICNLRPPWRSAIAAAGGQLPHSFHLSRRCEARTRNGSPCQSPAMPNGRCRMHGGTSPGAPKGNKNALKHGRYTAEAVARRREIAALLRRMRTTAREVRWTETRPLAEHESKSATES